MRRVPQNPTQRVIGFHVGCPDCGFVTSALQGMEGQTISESDAGVSFATPVVCLRCDGRMHIVRSECTFQGAANV